MRWWNLREIETPDGTRDPVVLDSEDDARAVLVSIHAGQELGAHQVKERAWLVVVDGTVRVIAGDESRECTAGTLMMFEPGERRSVSSDEGARVLLLLAPWPALNHYVGETRP